MSGMDRLTVNDLEYWEEYGDYDVKLMARELLAHRRASQAAPAPQETCTRCMGNGEIVTDWDTYLHPPKDATEDAVADCPDCDGTGHVVAAPAPSDGLREAANRALNMAREKIAERRNACPPGPLFKAFNEAMGDIDDVRFALSASPAQEGGE